jgi:LPXTG-site transpeptidase (sortase) family protein
MAYFPQVYLNKVKRIKFLLFCFAGLLGLSISSYAAFLKYQKTVLSFTNDPPKYESTLKRKALPSNISIAAVGIDLPIEEMKIVNGIWEISDNQASYLSTSARPGENGNIVIYGHNKRKIFGNLIGKKLQGQEVVIRTTDGDIYNYQINEIKTVDPNNINEVLPSTYEVLTIYTCTGLLDTKRLIIKAIPVVK